MFGKVHRQPFLEILRQLLVVAPVRFRQDQVTDFLPTRGNNLLANTAHWQHLSGQRELTGHGDVRLWRFLAGDGKQCGGHGDAGAGAVLGRGSLGYVQVHEGFVEESRVALEASEVG